MPGDLTLSTLQAVTVAAHADAASTGLQELEQTAWSPGLRVVSLPMPT